MIAPPIPADEAQRLAALRALKILDTPAEARFDRITRLAQRHFRAPIALVSLVDRERQWFKSRQGLGATETARGISFCGHAILQEGIFCVPDALADPRFADNPLVTGPPHIRFYAGAPLRGPDGARVGTLCVIDDRPRQLSVEDAAVLQDLAGCVEAELERTLLLRDQAERREAEAARRASEDKLRKLYEFSPLGIALNTMDGRYVEANPALLRMTGYSLRELNALDYWALTPSEYEAQEQEQLRALRETGRYGPYEKEYIRKDGSRVAVALNGVLITGGDGEDCIWSTVEDISQRRHLADTLRLQSQAVEAGTVGITIADAGQPDMPLIYANPAFAAITGYARDEVVGRNCRFLQGEARDQPGLAEVRAALRAGRACQVLLRNFRKDGRPFWNDFSLAPVRDEAGRLTHFIGITHDVTDRIETEQALKRSRALLDSVIEHMPAMVFLKRASDLRFELLNRAGEELLGYRREELLGRNDHDFFPTGQAEAFIARDREVLAGRQVVDIPEEPIQTRDGQTRYLHTLKIGLYDESGAPTHLLGISMDITGRRAAEEALRRQHDLAGIIGQAQTRFIREKDTRSLFDGLLADLLALTRSEYGFIGEVLRDPNGVPYLKTHALTNIAWDEATRRFHDEHAPSGLEFRNLKTLFGAAITTGEVVIANSPGTDPRRGGLPPGHPAMHAFLGVPIFLGEAMVGMVGVANRPGGYDTELVEFLQPLFRTMAHLIGALRNEKARQNAQAALERQQEALRALNEIAALPDLEPKAQLRRALALGARHLGLEFGIVSQIDGEGYIVEAQVSPTGGLADGQRLAPGETFCGLAMGGEDVLAIAHVGESEHAGHPCYRRFRLETYIGVPYLVDGRRHGTVNFGSTRPRQADFEAGDLEFMRLLARWVGATLQRQRSLALLREGAVRTKAIVDNVVDGIITINEQGMIESFNPAAERIFGYTAAEVIGRNVSLLMPEPHRGAHDGYLRHYLDGGEPRVIGKGREVEGRRKDGGTFTLELSVSEIRLDTQRIFTGVVRDITERKRAAETLRELSALNEAILDSANYSIIATDVDGTIRRFNAAAERMLGYRAEEVVGRATPAIIHDPQEVAQRAAELGEELGDPIEPGFEVFVRKARGGTVEEREWTYVRKDGGRFPVLLSVTALRDARGAINGFLGIASDISERRKVDRLKNEFISTVSHELRTPLTSIRGALGLMAGGALGELPDKARELVEIANKNSERLTLLINDILDIEKIASGQMKFDLRPHPLMPLVGQAVEANAAYGEQFGVAFRLTGAVADGMIRVDGDRLLQVLYNLLSNAAKFSPAGAEVDVAVERRGAHLRVSVTDRGPGIPEAFRDRIFQKFSQADASDTRQRGGSGLGLSISKAIVERMGGRIGFETEAGAGSTFHFDFPEWRATDAAAPAEHDRAAT
jgi:PAS domain S-box-containing protein